jgi:Holliday junction resolvase
MQPMIQKASGEKQQFSPEKLKQSLKRAGADDRLIDAVHDDLQSHLYDGITTKEIYRKAFTLLRNKKLSYAARYSLKKAIMELGPTGYPFEHFVGQVLSHHGFNVEVGKTLQGQCVNHEVDVLATQNNTQYIIECKFYNSQGKFANVRVPLYVRSRVDDIIKFRERLPEYANTKFFGWVVTNTRFTEDALTYGRCAGLHLVGWDLPKEKSLKDMIEKHNLFPITVLTGLNQKSKSYLLDKGIVLCRQLHAQSGELDGLGMNKNQLRKIKEELNDLCSI